MLDLFIYATLIGGAVLLVQLAMTLFGLDDLFGEADGGGAGGGGMEIDVDADFDADASGEGSGFWLIEMLSLRTLTAALAFFGLGGWISVASGASNTTAIVVACVTGYAAMYSVYWSLKQMLKLETSGNLDIRSAIGQPGKVYIPIPADRSGSGKVQMRVQQRLVEYRAMTESPHALKTGDQVTVVDLVSTDTLLVDPVSEPAA